MIEERAVCDVRRDPTATEETSRVFPDSDISSSRPRGGGHGANSGHNSGAPARAAWCCYARPSAVRATWLACGHTGRSGRFLISNIRTCGVSDRVSGDVRGMCVGRRTRCGTNKRTYDRRAARRGVARTVSRRVHTGGNRRGFRYSRLQPAPNHSYSPTAHSVAVRPLS